jgi:DNA-binding response OmpR family regulator
MTQRMAVGTQLLDERDAPAWAARPWEQNDPVLPGREGTLLAVVPLPGTGTSLAIVGYVVSAVAGQDTTRQAAAAAPPPAQTRAGDEVPVTQAGLVIDDVQRRLWVDGAEVPLTFQEFELLAFLLTHQATVFSRGELAAAVWHRELGRDSRTVDVHVSRLRAKLGPVYGRFLVTEYRAGYQYRPSRA